MLTVTDVITGDTVGTLDVRNGEPVVDGAAGWLLTVERQGVRWQDWAKFQRAVANWSNGYLLVARGQGHVAAGIDGDDVEAHLPGRHDQRNHGRNKGRRDFQPFTRQERRERARARRAGQDPDRDAPAPARQGRRAMAMWEAYAKELGLPSQLTPQQRRDLELAAQYAADMEADVRRIREGQSKKPVKRKKIPEDMDVQADLRAAVNRQRDALDRITKAMISAYEMEDKESGLRVKATGPATISGGRVLLELRIEDGEGNRVGTCQRVWMVKNVTTDPTQFREAIRVEHAFLSLRSTVRGGGFARRFNANAEEVYKEAGVDAIEIHADIDVGGYAWAKQGYLFQTFSQAQHLMRQIRPRAAAMLTNPEERSAFLKLAGRMTEDNFKAGKAPTPMELAMFGWKPGADTWPGKRMMLNSDWYGIKPMNQAALSLAAAATASPADVMRFSEELDLWHEVWTEEFADDVPVKETDRHPNGRGESDYNEHHHDISAPTDVDDVFWFGALALVVGQPLGGDRVKAARGAENPGPGGPATDPGGGGGERVAAAAPPATVDVQGMDAAYRQAVADMTSGWEQASGALVAALAAAVAAEAAGGALAGLATLAIPRTATTALTRVVTDGMLALAATAAQAAAVEVQPIRRVPADLSRTTRQRITDTARTVTDLIVAGYRSAATRIALAHAGAKATVDEVRDTVAAALADLSTAKESGLVAGNLSTAAGTAQGLGREQVLAQLPDGVRFRASEELDRNTCGPCRRVDGREYPDLEAALADYPTGRYRDCEGWNRCRGFIYAVVEEDPESGAEG